MKIWSFGRNWIWSSVASATSVSRSQSDISLFAPRLSPRVLNNNILGFVITYSYNTMIKSITTVTENTSTIELPTFSINTKRNWLFFDGMYDCNTITRSNINVVTNGESNFAFYIAICTLGNIGIFIFSLNSVFNNVFESIIH